MPKKGDAEFLGWTTESGSTTVDYSPGETIKNIKKQPIYWEKIFAHHISDKGLIIKIHNEFMQLIRKK